MKTALLALAILSLTGCHVGSSKDAPPVDHSSAPAPAVNKSIEKSRDAMLGKSMNPGSEHWAGTPAAATSTAKPAATGKSDVGGVAPASSSTAATASKGG
ncbi:MAG TPA: hypothetical protein VN043_05570 [Rhodanobacter sp.]|nr:hypothetical protein [Rhodanobacter sp.]